MNNSIRSLFVFCLAGCLTVFQAQATVLLDDTFADGTRNNQNLPTDAAWYVSTPSSWNTSAGAMSVTMGTGAILGVSYFGANSSSPISLQPGDTLTATLKFTFAGVATGSSSGGFRIGLFDFADSTLSPKWTTADLSGNGVLGTGVQGYALFGNMGTGYATLDIRKRTTTGDTSLLGTSGDFTSLGSGGTVSGFTGFVAGTQYSLQLSITRSNSTALVISATWQNVATGASVTWTDVDASAPSFNFDGIGFRPNSAASTATTITCNEVKMEVISAGAPPSFSFSPSDASAYTGQSAFFSVVAGGSAPLVYQWYFNTNTPVAGGTSSTLTLTNLQVVNSGYYQCVVTNVYGSATSDVAQLTVTDPVAPSLLSQPQGVVVLPGANATFSVSASGSTPLSYQWYLNTNTAIAGANNPTLTVNNVQPTNAGTYSVVVNNLAGSATSTNAVLTLDNSPVAPAFTSQPASLVVVSGGSASFSGAASGSVPLYFQWLKNNAPISGATSASLVLTNVQNADAGTYTLIASNSVGVTGSTAATLTVSTGVVIPNSAFNLTGFGAATTGGGIIPDTDPAYRKVTNALDLANALVSAYKTAGSVKVIEVMNDLDMGWNEVGSAVQNLASTPFRSHNPPQLHPRLLVTGVSLIDVKPRSGLTIFSASGATIRHATLNIKSASNVIVRNLRFDEMWEWDEATKGNYDKNDWDFIDLGNGGSVSNIWVDHCTFTKTYDGILDTKAGSSAITISWCKYTGDDGATNANSWVRQQISSLESNRTSYAFYNFLRNNGFSSEDIIAIIQGHDKTHLAGANDLDPNNATISMTFHHLWLNSVWDRCVPRLRAGNVHDYNIYVDDSLVYAAKSLRNARAAVMSTANQNTLNNTYSFNPPINGSISTENGALQVEKSVYIDCLTPLRNNQTDPSNPAYTGKIQALDTIYQMNSTFFRGNSTDSGGAHTLGPVQAPIIAFSWNLPGNQLPYSYTMDDPAQLQGIVAAGAGAGVVNWSKTNWLLTAYAPSLPVIEAQPESQSLAVSNSVTFTVAVSGSAPLNYQWYFNTNTAVSGATNVSLTLTNLQSTNAGSYSIVVSNNVGSVTSSVAVLTISATAGFAGWQAANFTSLQLSDPAISGPAAAPASDGVPNLVKYALGLPPLVPVDPSRLSSLTLTNGTWAFIYHRPAGVTDVVYDLETSSDLSSWSNGSVVQQLIGTDTNSLQIWGATYTGTPGPVRFYQLRLQH